MRPQPERDPRQIVFHAQSGLEFNVHPNVETQIAQLCGLKPVYHPYLCGACGSSTTGRVLCDVHRQTDGAHVRWCICACEKREPTVIIEKGGEVISQLPTLKQFHSSAEWPKELADLYDEAARSYSAGAFTSASMVCRKLLMSCACHEQAKAKVTVEEGKPFAFYVDYLANAVLNFPAAKAPIDAIRQIGNDANHHVQMINQAEAERSMKIVHRMLDTIYVLPNA